MQPAPQSPAPLRLAEVLGTLSLASDLAMGQPSEQGLRAVVLATRLAEHETLALRQDVYLASLLRYLGCNAFAVEEGVFGAGDDIGLRESFMRTDLGRPAEFLGAVLRDVGRGAPLGQRAAGVARLLSQPVAAPMQHALAQCDAALHFGRGMGLGDGVLQALAQTDERFDGRGLPLGLAGESLSPAMRYAEVARVAVVYCGLHGYEAAAAELRRRAGGHLDPAIVARFQQLGPTACEDLLQQSVWDVFLAIEPGLRLRGAGTLRPVFEAFAQMADLKSGYLSGHSPAVARLAAAAARAQGLPETDVELLYQAALVHDLGRLAVPTGVWDKPGPLSVAEWERVRLHSHFTDRVLRRSPALQRHADIAGRAHERLDGSGYHRGSADLEPLARLLAAADMYRACTETRPWRPAHTPAAAAKLLQEAVAGGGLDARAADAVLQAAGQTHATTLAKASKPGPTAPAHGLTAREVDVLRLMVQGLSNKQIGKQLGISPRTVQHHSIHIFGKSGARSRAGAALWAVAQGLYDA